MKHIEVVAAMIYDAEGRIFATQRGYGEWKDYWEFPGGKMVQEDIQSNIDIIENIGNDTWWYDGKVPYRDKQEYPTPNAGQPICHLQVDVGNYRSEHFRLAEDDRQNEAKGIPGTSKQRKLLVCLCHFN